MKNKLIYENIGYVLLERFPELQERAGKDDLKAEAPLAYPLFEIFFKEFFFELLETSRDNPLLSRIFSFLEEMADSPDRDVTDLLSFYGVTEGKGGGKLREGLRGYCRGDLHVQLALLRVAFLPRGRDHRALKGGTEGAAGVVDDPA